MTGVVKRCVDLETGEEVWACYLVEGWKSVLVATEFGDMMAAVDTCRTALSRLGLRQDVEVVA